jgi:antitoxin (DNA-binding transcriptional repressor) of toxin-antitoxin stability system
MFSSMNAVSLSEAQQHLVELVHDLARRGELLITDNNQPVARLSPVTPTSGRASLRDLQPSSVGAVLRPFPSSEDDTLGEMLDARK